MTEPPSVPADSPILSCLWLDALAGLDEFVKVAFRNLWRARKRLAVAVFGERRSSGGGRAWRRGRRAGRAARGWPEAEVNPVAAAVPTEAGKKKTAKRAPA